MPSTLRPYQVDLIRSPTPEVVAVGAQQSGKSYVLACWLLGRAWERPGSICWWAAPTYAQSQVGYDRIMEVAGRSGCIEPRGLWKYRRITLVNGSWIDFRSWDREENLLGPSVWAMVIDQAELLTMRAHSILSGRRSATLGPIAYGGNAGLTHGEFWRVCEQARRGATGVAKFFGWTWEHVAAALPEPQRSGYLAFLETERVRTPREEFERMYEGKFLSVGTGVVDLAPICVNGGSALEPVPLPYAEPWEERRTCVAGLDLGQVEDPTVLTVLESDEGRLKAMDRFKNLSWDAVIARVLETLKRYASPGDRQRGVPPVEVSLFVDATGLGEPVYEALSAACVTNGVDVVPVVFTQARKATMVSAVQVAVQRREISMPWIAEAVEEAAALERAANGSYSAAKGFHDDVFWSLALACYARTRVVRVAA